MAIFEYDALTSSGRLMKGTVEAASWQQAQIMLGDMKLVVNQLQKAKEQKPKTAVGVQNLKRPSLYTDDGVLRLWVRQRSCSGVVVRWREALGRPVLANGGAASSCSS